MRSATAFLRKRRALPVLRSPAQRLTDWNEFHEHLPESILREQAGRCMDCGVPFCHTGSVLNGAACGCPLNNLIPDWNFLASTGNWRSALDLLQRTNNFPEFTGRVCPAPCEGSCVLGIDDEPVTIKSIECEIVDRGFAEGWIVPQVPLRRTSKTIAVVGSGPAGLACAAELNKAGHTVTVFEKSDRIGGLLMYGIPNMKLEKQVVQRRVNMLAKEGVVFVTNTEIGRDYPAPKLVTNFDAVVLCGGSSKPRDLAVEGRHLAGIHFAMDFLKANTKSLLDCDFANGDYISAAGKDVIVIGGGDTGTDCVATALRHGCRSLVQFEIMPQPGPARSSNNPWPQWPRIYRVDYGHEEAIAVHGADPRSFSVKTKSFLGDQGHLTGIQTVQLSWRHEADGRRVPVEVGGTMRSWPAQLVLIAMGFVGTSNVGLVDELGLALSEVGTIRVDQNQMTSIPGVFAAGDIQRGQSLVVWAIADGRKAAKGVAQYLSSQCQP